MESVTELPFNRLIGVRRDDADGSLFLSGDERYGNHLGTVHAGALLALAEAASGEWLLEALRSEVGLVPVVRRMESKFRRPAMGRITASSGVGDAEWERFLTSLDGRSRAMLPVRVDLADEAGAVVMSAVVEWFVTR